jgi:hypothetical protein
MPKRSVAVVAVVDRYEIEAAGFTQAVSFEVTIGLAAVSAADRQVRTAAGFKQAVSVEALIGLAIVLAADFRVRTAIKLEGTAKRRARVRGDLNPSRLRTVPSVLGRMSIGGCQSSCRGMFCGGWLPPAKQTFMRSSFATASYFTRLGDWILAVRRALQIMHNGER